MNCRRTFALGLYVCAAGALIGCGSGGLGAPALTIEATNDLVFIPASPTAQVGDVVVFKNIGSIQHTVTFQDTNDQCLTDAALNPGSTWEVKFTKSGTYHFLCTIHAPNMKGEITVTGS